MTKPLGCRTTFNIGTINETWRRRLQLWRPVVYNWRSYTRATSIAAWHCHWSSMLYGTVNDRLNTRKLSTLSRAQPRPLIPPSTTPCAICWLHCLIQPCMTCLLRCKTLIIVCFNCYPLNEAQRIRQENMNITLNCMSITKFFRQSFVVNCLFNFLKVRLGSGVISCYLRLLLTLIIVFVIIFETFDVQFWWHWSTAVQGHQTSIDMVPIRSPLVISCTASIASNIVSLMAFEIFLSLIHISEPTRPY